MSTNILSQTSKLVNVNSRRPTSSRRSDLFVKPTVSLSGRVQSANANPLSRVEQLKRKFISTQFASLRNQIYATLRQAGSSHAMALAEIDRALREVVSAAQKASVAATNAAASADAAGFDKADSLAPVFSPIDRKGAISS